MPPECKPTAFPSPEAASSVGARREALYFDANVVTHCKPSNDAASTYTIYAAITLEREYDSEF